MSVLGYLALDKLGWRVFVVLTSLPVFIPPIIILHFFISPEQEESEEDKIDEESEVLSIFDVIARTCKATLFIATGFFESWSTILLLPALIKMLNTKQGSAEDCENITQGSEFFLLALVSFAELGGRICFYFLYRKIRFRIMFVLLVMVMSGSYTAMLVTQYLPVAVLTNCLVKGGTGMMMQQFTSFNYDPDYYGTKRLAVCSSLSKGCGTLMGVVGVTLACFTAPQVTVVVALVLSVIQIFTVITMTEI